MPVSSKIEASIAKSSWIRGMFETGLKLKAQFGADKVYDFSLGNPDLPPPAAFKEQLLKTIAENRPGLHSYMPNAGWPEVRESVAAFLKKEQGHDFTGHDIVMTVGAGGGLNVVLKTVLEPGDEVIVSTPYFMEYSSYVDNHGGRLKTVSSGPDFNLDVEAVQKALTPASRVVLINSPHNPTGAVYGADTLKELGRRLKAASDKYGRPIILLADEPYRKIVYNNLAVPTVFGDYPYVAAATSYSKDLSLPGERLGFVAVHPEMPRKDKFVAGLIVANRVLGYVNAPSLMQMVVSRLQGQSVDINLYQQRRDLFVKGLREAGYELNSPAGAFYLFPKSPLADDTAFIKLLQEENILAVPGSGFAGPGHFRLCYCVPETVIANSLPGFARARAKAENVEG